MYLSLEHLTKKFPSRGIVGEVTAVDDVSLGIENGEFVTLLGPSGCGKTTTLRLIAGFEFPTSGNIMLDGLRINDTPPNRRDMAMVFQSYAVFPHLSVYENIAYGLKVKKRPMDEIKQRIVRVMALTKLTGLEDRAPNQISGGQQQRVALARALVVEPKVLLFDEPLSNLDAKLREEMRFEIRDLQKRLGITAIYVTHAQEEALVMSDKIAVMNKGKLEQLGSPEEIYEFPRSKFVADFIGLSDFIPVCVESINGERTQVSFGDTLLTATSTPGLTPKQTVTLFIRPNDIDIAKDGHEQNVLSGRIKLSTYLGDVLDYRVQVKDNLVLRVQTNRANRFAAGDTVRLHLPIDRCRLIPEE